MEVLSRRVSSGSMTYRFNGFEVTMPRPVDVKFRALTAEVLAADAEGNPFLGEEAVLSIDVIVGLNITWGSPKQVG